MEKPQARVLTGLRKRQQIEQTNKRIFLWLAVSSIVISFCLVALQFLVREFVFNQKVINAKGQTNKQLKDNIVAAKQLTQKVNALLADTNLSAVKGDTTNAQASNLSIVLDALPVKGDSTGFANSLQTVILPRSGVSISELNTNDFGAGEDMTAVGTEQSSQPTAMPFKAGFSGTYDQVQTALTDFSKVIRPISGTELSIKSTDDKKLQVMYSGVTYYLPERKIEIRSEAIKP